VLPDGVMQHIFEKNGAASHVFLHGRRKDFFQGGAGTSGIFQKFLWGVTKSGEFVFLSLETKITAFFVELFKFLLPFRRPCLRVGKVSATPLKNL